MQTFVLPRHRPQPPGPTTGSATPASGYLVSASLATGLLPVNGANLLPSL
jgi:hypothetical protein